MSRPDDVANVEALELKVAGEGIADLILERYRGRFPADVATIAVVAAATVAVRSSLRAKDRVLFIATIDESFRTMVDAFAAELLEEFEE